MELTMRRFSLRALFAVTAVVAAVIWIGILLWNGLADAHPAAVRNDYLKGKITLQQAREEIGDEVDTWSDYDHERAKVMREIGRSANTP
jgi:hypothetical protein